MNDKSFKSLGFLFLIILNDKYLIIRDQIYFHDKYVFVKDI